MTPRSTRTSGLTRGTTTRMSDWIRTSAEYLRLTLASKNEDYKVDSEFSNFTEAADLPGIDPMDVMLGQLGIKYTRLKGLTRSESANYESMEDTLLDLAGYAIITHAYMRMLKDESEQPVVFREL